MKIEEYKDLVKVLLQQDTERDAAFKAAGWLSRGLAVRVAVNVSAVQFQDDNFTRKVFQVLQESGLPPTLFELEITESIAMSDPERVGRLLEPIRAKGVRIAMDDFGTGHSNLASLTRLPFDVFKIDQSFVQALGKDRTAPTMIETIIAMAGGLNYETVAEGVETPEQAAFLKNRGATIGQGYLFGEPMPMDQFEAYVRKWANSGMAIPAVAAPAPPPPLRASDIVAPPAAAPVIMSASALRGGS